MTSTRRIFLVRPASFAYNEQTAPTNAFQARRDTTQDLAPAVLREFDAFAAALRATGIDVTVFEDSPNPPKPDAIFPNNWISMHADGTLVLYPMCAPNRRHERQEHILAAIKSRFGVTRVVDLSAHEAGGKFLEGTGSVVFDHINKAAYAALSPRTDKDLVHQLCALLGYAPFTFTATDTSGAAIYHTNVMMCVGRSFATVCLESIADAREREALRGKLHDTGHELVDISYEQMNNFAGNMLELQSAGGDRIIALSERAHKSLLPGQRAALERHAALLPLSIPTIETVGGGSARCMITEIFLPSKGGLFSPDNL